jgi:hypothetical protein
MVIKQMSYLDDQQARMLGGTTDSTDYYKQFMQYMVNDRFNLASDVYTIQMQDRVSLIYNNISVRVTTAVMTEDVPLNYTEDDYRQIVFQNCTQAVMVSDMFSFEDNFWIVINTNNIFKPTRSCTVRRCNNVLKCILPSGLLIEQPCVITEISKRSMAIEKDGTTMESQKMPYLVTAQSNVNTLAIPINYRFLFGQKMSYRVTDINDVSLTFMITFLVTANQNRETDDFLITGLADNDVLQIPVPSGAFVINGNSEIPTGGTQNYSVAYDNGNPITGINFTFTIDNSSTIQFMAKDGLNCSITGRAVSQIKLTATSNTDGTSVSKIITICNSF